LVDPIPVTVVRMQDRDVALGASAVLERLDAARHRARLVRAFGPPRAPFSLESLLQRDINLEQVDRLKGGRLIEDRARRIYDVNVNRDSQRLPGAEHLAK
jgi:hypothetical protein